MDDNSRSAISATRSPAGPTRASIRSSRPGRWPAAITASGRGATSASTARRASRACTPRGGTTSDGTARLCSRNSSIIRPWRPSDRTWRRCCSGCRAAGSSIAAPRASTRWSTAACSSRTTGRSAPSCRSTWACAGSTRARRPSATTATYAGSIRTPSSRSRRRHRPPTRETRFRKSRQAPSACVAVCSLRATATAARTIRIGTTSSPGSASRTSSTRKRCCAVGGPSTASRRSSTPASISRGSHRRPTSSPRRTPA